MCLNDSNMTTVVNVRVNCLYVLALCHTSDLSCVYFACHCYNSWDRPVSPWSLYGYAEEKGWMCCNDVLTLFFPWLTSGGLSADPPTAGEESAAGRAEPEEALSHGHPEEDEQSTHAAADHLPCGWSRHPRKQLKPKPHLQVCSICCSGSQNAPYHWQK